MWNLKGNKFGYVVVLGEPFLLASLASFPSEGSAFIDVTHTQLLCLNIHF